MRTPVFTLLNKALDHLEEWVLFLSVMGALIALFLNVLLRYGFHHSLAWSEELVREVIILTTFLGCSVAIRRGQQVTIDAAVQIFTTLRRPLLIIHYLATLIFALLLIYYGWQMVHLMLQTGQSTIIMHIPLAWLYAILPLTGVLMTIRTLQAMTSTLRSKP